MRFALIFLCFVQTALSSEIYTGLDDIVPFRLHPVHGYFLKKTKILENARSNGLYGGIDYLGALKTFRQSTFESHRKGDYDRKLENDLNYPLEPIAAFIQWCYPSPARITLSANTNCQDPLGQWARDITSQNIWDKTSARQQMGYIIDMVDKLYQAIDWNQHQETVFCDHFKRLFDSDMIRQKYIDSFAHIVFQAIKADVTDVQIKIFYPSDMVRRTLLAYITDVISDRDDLLAIYKYAKLIPDDYNVPPVPLTREVYNNLKIELLDQAGSLSDYARLLHGAQIYESYLPPYIKTLRSTVRVGQDSFSFADCGEISILNFFLTFVWHEGKIQSQLLDHLDEYPGIHAVRKFFTQYSTWESLSEPNAHNAWSTLIANRNGDIPADSLLRIEYICHNVAELAGAMPSLLNLFTNLFMQSDRLCNEIEHKNFIDMTVLGAHWETADISSPIDQALAFDKWQAICNLLNHPYREHKVELVTDNGKTIGLTDTVQFQVADNIFCYNVSNSHFEIFSHQFNINNTRDINLKAYRLPNIDAVMANCFGWYHPTLGLFQHVYSIENNQYLHKLLKKNYSDQSLETWEPKTENAHSPSEKSNPYIMQDYCRTIFFRGLITWAYQALNEQFYIDGILEAIEELYPMSPQEIIEQTMIFAPARDFWLYYFLPNVFDSEPLYVNALINHLKNHHQYTTYVRELMASSHHNKWRFAARFNENRFFDKLVAMCDDPDHPDYPQAKSILEGPVDDNHPLADAIKGKNLIGVKKLTNNGKADYWKIDSRQTVINKKLNDAKWQMQSLPIVKFLDTHDPDRYISDNGEPIKPELIVGMSNTPEVFEYLMDKFNLTVENLKNCHHLCNSNVLSFLDVALRYYGCNRYALFKHVLSKYPEIKVTDQTMLILLMSSIGNHHEYFPAVADLIIDHYTGQYGFIGDDNGIRLVSDILMTNQAESLWLLDKISQKFHKPRVLNDRWIVLLTSTPLPPYCLWSLLRGGFTLDTSQAEQLTDDPIDQTILWMLGHRIGDQPRQTLIEELYLLKKRSMRGRHQRLNRQFLDEPFMRDLKNLVKELGYDQTINFDDSYAGYY